MEERIIATVGKGNISIYYGSTFSFYDKSRQKENNIGSINEANLHGYCKTKISPSKDGSLKFDGVASVVGVTLGTLNHDNWEHRQGLEGTLKLCKEKVEELFNKHDRNYNEWLDFKLGMLELYAHLHVAGSYRMHRSIVDHSLSSLVATFPVQGIIKGPNIQFGDLTRVEVDAFKESRDRDILLKIGDFPEEELQKYF